MSIFLSPDNRRWATVMTVVLILSVSWTFLSRVPASATTNGELPASPREGFPAPDLTLDQLYGGQVSLSQLRGKVVMINLWASWCAPCRIEMPAIEKVYRAYKDQGFIVLGVNSTFQDSESDAIAFVQEMNLTFPILLDRTGSVSHRYQLRALPSTYFVDRQGITRVTVFGGMNATLIESKVVELLKGIP